MNFKNISESGCHKTEVGQSNWQRIGLVFLILQHKKKIRQHETLTQAFTKRIEDKTNQNNNNGKKQIEKNN